MASQHICVYAYTWSRVRLSRYKSSNNGIGGLRGNKGGLVGHEVIGGLFIFPCNITYAVANYIHTLSKMICLVSTSSCDDSVTFVDNTTFRESSGKNLGGGATCVGSLQALPQ